VLTAVESTLSSAGFEIETARYGVSQDLHRFFGTLDLTTAIDPNVGLAVGIRNSTDQTFPLAFCAGHRVFVCDNLAFVADLMVTRKHTRFGEERFAAAIALAIGQLEQFRRQEAARIQCFRRTEITDILAESCILRGYEAGIISHRQLPHVVREWRLPSHGAFEDRTMWSLLNAFTAVMNGRAKTNPQVHAKNTMALQSLLCGFIGYDSPVIDVTPKASGGTN
jgi:hypothetical protein